jgi:signal transduction histidine kinase
MLEQLGSQVDETIDQLRSVAHGVYPLLLEQYGIAAALTSSSRHMALSVAIDDQGLTRHAQARELTVCYCCSEALQNAARHAGPGASVTIRLSEDDRGLHFTIEDDGLGFDPAAAKHGRGLTNLADRVAAHGGTIEIDSSPGRGTRVTGQVPGGARRSSLADAQQRGGKQQKPRAPPRGGSHARRGRPSHGH